MANCSVGANATRISKTFEGICVNTIVFTRPILSAIFAAAMYDKAVKIPAAEKRYDKIIRSAPNLGNNHTENTLWITKPPANESTAKRADSLPTIFFDLGDRVCLIELFPSGFISISLEI